MVFSVMKKTFINKSKVWRLKGKIDFGDFLAPCARASCFELRNEFSSSSEHNLLLSRDNF